MQFRGTRSIYTIIKWNFIVLSIVVITFVLITTPGDDSKPTSVTLFGKIALTLSHSNQAQLSGNWRNLTTKQINSLSELGRYLFLDLIPPMVQTRNKSYKILIWKKGKFLERRHIYHFGLNKFDPFEKCSQQNCELTYDDNDLPDADAVVFHLQSLKPEHLPVETKPRPENQRWIFLTDETPLHTFLVSGVKMSDFNGKFNWSMTYRMNSDVPVPYGRTVLKNRRTNEKNDDNEVKLEKRLDVLVAAVGSNCGQKNHRWNYVHELQKYIDVDFYGACGKLKCAGHYDKDCINLTNYKFFLSFENSNCAEYITEKLWWNAYAKQAIPVVMGAAKIDYQQLLPPNSYINVADFARPVDLARYLLYVNKTHNIYQSYFEWKNNFELLNEHGYFQTDSYHYCRICEALHYNNDEKKVYNSLETFWTQDDCYRKWDDE